MARRRHVHGQVPKALWTKAFGQDETKAIEAAIEKLYRRSLYHLVAGQYNLPNLAAVYQSLIPDDVNRLLTSAREIMVDASNNYWADFEVTVPVGPATLEVKTKARFLPDTDKYTPAAPIPDELRSFAYAAAECQQQWQHVRGVFDKLNEVTKRSGAAFHWPCSLALMKLGALEPAGLSDIQRPGSIPADIVVALRDTNAFVMQHTMLPKIDSGHTGLYEGDPATGIGARLFLAQHGSFDNQIWPLSD